MPADFRQLEDRLQDVHLGKRTVPPMNEYLCVENTVDSAMIQALLKKMRRSDEVVGMDWESEDLAEKLRKSGMINNAKLGLPNTDKDTIKAAMASIRERFLRPPPVTAADNLHSEAMGLDDDVPAPEAGDDDIPF